MQLFIVSYATHQINVNIHKIYVKNAERAYLVSTDHQQLHVEKYREITARRNTQKFKCKHLLSSDLLVYANFFYI